MPLLAEQWQASGRSRGWWLEAGGVGRELLEPGPHLAGGHLIDREGDELLDGGFELLRDESGKSEPLFVGSLKE